MRIISFSTHNSNSLFILHLYHYINGICSGNYFFVYTFFNTILSLSNNILFHLICKIISYITQVKLSHLPITSTFIYCSQIFMDRESKSIQWPPFLSLFVSNTNSSNQITFTMWTQPSSKPCSSSSAIEQTFLSFN